jgi:hypothetical protein
MAFGLILHSTISNHEGVAVKVELYKDGFAGSATEILESSKIELHTVGDENEYKPIRQTKLSWILEARNQNILDIVYDIHAQPEGTYLVKVLYDGVEEYTGIATVDEYTEPDEYFPIPVEVTAHDLAALKSLEADYTDARVYVLNYIADELKKLGFELPIRTINEYYPFGGTYGETDTDDSLKTLQFNPLTFFEAEDDEEGISSEEGTVDTSYSALEQICSAYNIELIQKANEWWLIQLPELTQNSIRLRRYNADGVYQDSSTYDPRRTLDSSLRVLSGGIRRKNIGYRRALAAYQHGDIQTWLIRNFDFAQEQAIIGVPIYWEYTGNDADVRIRPVNTDSKYAVYLPPTAEVDPLPFGTPYPHDIGAGDFASLGSHVLKQSGGVIATKSGVTNTLKISVSAVVTGGPQVLPLAPMFYLVKVGNYYLKSDGSWTASVNYINFERGGIRYGGFRIDEIETDELIEDGNVYVELSQIIRTAETGPIDGVAWDFLDIDLLEDGEGAQQTRTFIGSVTTETRTSEGFELPTTKVGDGVFASHPGALYMPSQTAYTSSSWKYRSITQRLIHELNIQNTLNLFGRPRNSFDMYMVGYIHPSQVVTRDGIRYRPVDVVWDLISNESRVITVEIRSESVTVDYRRVDSAERFTTIRGITTGGTGVTIPEATVVGQNLVTLPSPNEITFIRINADNTVSTLVHRDFRQAIYTPKVTVDTVAPASPDSGDLWVDMDADPFDPQYVLSVQGQTGHVQLDTDDIPEGVDHLYFTTARARASVSADPPLLYNVGTGVFGLSYTVQNLKLTADALNTIQDIHTTATPRFARLGLGQAAHATYSIYATNTISGSEYRVSNNLVINNARDGFLQSLIIDDQKYWKTNTFVLGLTGEGAGTVWDSLRGYVSRTDDLWVSGALYAYEFIVQQYRVFNGNFGVTSGAKIVAKDQVIYEAELTIEVAGEVQANPFIIGDRLLIQNTKVGGTSNEGGHIVKSIELQVQQIMSSTEIGCSVISGSYASIEPGDSIVRIGHVSNVARQGSIWMSSDDAGNPWIDVKAGVTSLATFRQIATTKTRMGRLDNLFSSTNEFGLFAGDGIGTDDSYVRISNQGIRLNNLDFRVYDGGTLTAWIDPTDSGKLTLGVNASSITVANTDVGTILDGAGYIKVYQDASNYLRYGPGGFDLRVDNTFNIQHLLSGTPNHLFQLRGDTSGRRGLYSEIYTNATTVHELLSVGDIYSIVYSAPDAFAQATGRRGIAYYEFTGSAANRLFELSDTVRQIAGINFDASKLWTGSGSDFVGIQARSTSATRVFFAGATSSSGADAKFYVTAEGNLYHASILTPIIMGERHADSAAASFVSTLVSWSSTSTSSLLKGAGNFAKRTGMEYVVVKARGSVETIGAVGQATIQIIRSDTGAQVISNDTLVWGTEAPDTEDLTLNIDISSLPDNVVYRVNFFIRRQSGSGNVFVRDPNVFASNLPWS